MNKINLNILGLKNFETSDLLKLRDEVETLRPTYSSVLYDSVAELKRKIQRELSKREKSNRVFVEFVAEWSGYSSSQKKEVGRFYRKFRRDLAIRFPSYWQHNFSDGTTNNWYIKIVDIKGKDSGSYSAQIDEFINSLNLK